VITPMRRSELNCNWRAIYWPEFTGKESYDQIVAYFSRTVRLVMTCHFDEEECDYVCGLALKAAGH